MEKKVINISVINHRKRDGVMVAQQPHELLEYVQFLLSLKQKSFDIILFFFSMYRNKLP